MTSGYNGLPHRRNSLDPKSVTKSGKRLIQMARYPSEQSTGRLRRTAGAAQLIQKFLPLIGGLGSWPKVQERKLSLNSLKTVQREHLVGFPRKLSTTDSQVNTLMERTVNACYQSTGSIMKKLVGISTSSSTLQNHPATMVETGISGGASASSHAKVIGVCSSSTSKTSFAMGEMTCTNGSLIGWQSVSNSPAE